ncbi:hypothetical protein [Shewanella nanhaiensis]|uniref:Uncharacterized protein n=1 Tax=Shewanella nanhaiensis TaxID=2864872 RepID=A0ABS7E133_9GAMM|nr:hypothetical protein [Shewanella nanhaiensis]MBW8183334.1 hypothetical protein [Shewanella nanhaiensis]
MIKKIGVAFTLLLISSLSVDEIYKSSSNTTTYSVSIGIHSAYAGSNDWDDEDDDWEEDYDDWEEDYNDYLDEWDQEIDRYQVVGQKLNWDEYELEEWLEELKDAEEGLEREEEEPDTDNGIDAQERCEIAATDNKRVCRNVANALAANTALLCTGFVNPGSIAVCEIINGLAWDDALSACDTAAEAAKAKCD